MKSIPPISAVMTPFPYSIDADSSVLEARDLMKQNEIRHLPVVEGGVLIGVLSQPLVEQHLHERSDEEGSEKPARDLMILHPYFVDLSEPLDRVLSEMAKRHVDSALITKQGRLAGIFTVTDACALFAEDLRARFGTDPGEEIA